MKVSRIESACIEYSWFLWFWTESVCCNCYVGAEFCLVWYLHQVYWHEGIAHANCMGSCWFWWFCKRACVGLPCCCSGLLRCLMNSVLLDTFTKFGGVLTLLEQLKLMLHPLWVGGDTVQNTIFFACRWETCGGPRHDRYHMSSKASQQQATYLLPHCCFREDHYSHYRLQGLCRGTPMHRSFQASLLPSQWDSCTSCRLM